MLNLISHGVKAYLKCHGTLLHYNKLNIVMLEKYKLLIVCEIYIIVCEMYSFL